MRYGTGDFPYFVKNRPQQHPQGPFPHQRPGQKAEAVATPQIPAAQTEALLQPQPEGQQQEQQIPQLRMGAPEGPQTVISQAQQHPQAAAVQKPMGSQSRRGHPNSRCRQPPARDSS